MEELIQKCVERIRDLAGPRVPDLALVLGSGFEQVVQNFKVHGSVPYRELGGFPVPGVQGHAGKLLHAEAAGLELLVCLGRAHYYEGWTMESVMFPVQALSAAGVTSLLLTNAAGGINQRYRPGDFMLFADHINFTGVNPLRGLAWKQGGDSFVDLSRAYSPRLRKAFVSGARRVGVKLHEGVYLGVSGPSYETPAEIRAFRKWGADAVGMSTIPEVLMARYCRMEVAALSCITNYAAGSSAAALSHEEVLGVGRGSAERASKLITAFAEELGKTARKNGKEKI